MKRDIANREDIELLVNTFYDKVKVNPVIGKIFTDIVKVDWEEHLPKMYDFWSGVLLGERGYAGNPMIKHIQLSRITKMSESEFTEWLILFNKTVDELFEGEKAEEARTRAANIARMMLYKIENL